MPVPATTEVATTSTPGWSSATVRATASASVARSALASTIAGVAPASQASVITRSSRPGLTGRSRPHTTSTASTLAARCWGVSVWAERRVSSEVRASTATGTSPSTATQSPTVGAGSRRRDSVTELTPAGSASVTAMPSWRTTRPGTSAGASEPATLRGPAASTTSASRADQRSFQP